MTFHFAFATDQNFYLAADRRRTRGTGEREGTFEDSRTKLHQVNPWTYITGAGFMYFVDDEVAQHSPRAFGPHPIVSAALAQAMPQMNDQLMSLFADVARQAAISDPSKLFSQFSLVGVGAAGEPFSCDWSSSAGWLGAMRVGRRHRFCLLRENPVENEALQVMINDLQGLALHGAKVEDVAGGAQDILAWVASRDDGVSAIGDMAIIGPQGSEEVQLD